MASGLFTVSRSLLLGLEPICRERKVVRFRMCPSGSGRIWNVHFFGLLGCTDV